MLSVLLMLGQAGAVWAEDADAPFPITSSSTTTIQEDGTVITTDGTGSSAAISTATGVSDSTAETTSDGAEPADSAYIPNDPWMDPDHSDSNKTEKAVWTEGDLSGSNWWAQAVRLPQAWYYKDYFQPMKVGVVDNGFDTDHEDLPISVLNPDENSQASHDHGTPVAAVLGASWDNSAGISGVMGNADLVGYSAGTDYANGWQGVNECLKNGCKVINLSWGLKSELTENYINEVADFVIENRAIYGDSFLLVQSAGNEDGHLTGSGLEQAGQLIKDRIGAADAEKYTELAALTAEKIRERLDALKADSEAVKEYPGIADLSVEEVMDCYVVVGSVARTQEAGNYTMAWHSNYGSSVSLCAPGVHILTAKAGASNAYQYKDGTSFAAPIVSGIAGLVWSVNPEMSNTQVKQILALTATSNITSPNWWNDVKDFVLPDTDNYYMVDAKSAVELALKSNGLLETDNSAHTDTQMTETPQSNPVQTETAVTLDATSLFDRFLDNEVPAYNPESEESFYFADISEGDWGYTGDAGNRVDLDNDGEVEQILDGMYGGMYLDVRDGRVVVLATGDGTGEALTYGYYEGKVWICHCDTTHQGRDWFHLDQYDGSGSIVDSFDLNANFFEGDLQDQYDPNDEYTFRDQNISMEQFISLVKEIFGQSAPGLTLSLGLPDTNASGDGNAAGDAGAGPETGGTAEGGADGTQAGSAAAQDASADGNHPEQVQEADYNGHHYVLYRNSMPSFDEAEAFCENMGGHLAVISDEGENEFLHSVFSPASHTTYIGLSEYGGWVDGSPLDYEPLCDFAEMNAPDVNVYYTIGEDGNKWDYWGWYADADHFFICEFDSWDGSASAETAGGEDSGSQDYLQALQTSVSYNGYASNTFASVDLSGTDEADSEDGYEFRNQTLGIPEFFDSEEAARAALAQTDGGMDVSGPDENGKWTVLLIPDGVRLKQIYAGSIYVRKNATVIYQNLVNGSPVTLETSAETFRSQWQQIAGTSLCFIKNFDENGHVTELEAMQFNMVIPEG